MINVKIQNLKTTNVKPTLSLLVDDSKSISFFKENKSVKDVINAIATNKEITNKFEIQQFAFGDEIQVVDSLTFSKPQTNISKAIHSVNEFQKNKIAPIVLISDGNQTIGQDYEFINSKQPIYPVIVGDTMAYADVKISQLNVNRYSYIKNKFPVEVILNYEGKKDVTTQFSISKKGKTVYRKNVRFSPSKKSVTVIANLTSTKEGIQYYTASIAKINNEKNIKNNTKTFSVNVIDEQTKVLLLTSILHPDLGALKKSIESNKQRTVEIINIDNFKNSIEDYQLLVLYQPDVRFKNIIDKIKQKNKNYLLVTGAKTDWDFINQKQLGFYKNAINQTENYGAVYNDAFLTFLQNDLGFNDVPPLKDKFGELTISKEHQTLLFQNINGVQLNSPLLATFDTNNQKSGLILGEGIWRWRAHSFLNTNSFEDFDRFIGNLTQYLASNKKRDRLEINAASLYPANSTITIAAFYTDKNYQFDARANLEITITNSKTNQALKVPFSLVNNSFQTEIENLPSGDYTYIVTVLGQNINKFGRFKITDYQIENQFTNANSNTLQKLADKSKGSLYYKNQIDQLMQELLTNTSFYTIQKTSKTQQNLIDWKWILAATLALLAAEWFIRKYYGKI
ncbi:VWA domain-containing protein [Polaribacter sp. R77954]|uniref:VWA domain-containing protein n=1 Tax=Polaribacter sp. R77954 TaxID=3093870 RepID=UPI0037CA1199